MKRMVLILGLALALTGCADQAVYETVADVVMEPVMAQAQALHLDLPREAALQTMEDGKGQALYFCDGYTLAVQTLEAGDLEKTIRTVTGFEKDQLQLLQTDAPWGKRYDCIWTCAGEGEDQVGRLALLDDGAYHYVLTAMAGASKMDAVGDSWDALFRSAELVSSLEDLHSGS